MAATTVVERVERLNRASLRRVVEPDVDLPGEVGPGQVIADELRALRGQEVIELSLRGVQLLRLFADNVGAVIDRDRIFAACWGIDHYPNSRTIDQHIAKLRKKIEADPRDPQIIRTVHGVGYRYEG